MKKPWRDFIPKAPLPMTLGNLHEIFTVEPGERRTRLTRLAARRKAHAVRNEARRTRKHLRRLARENAAVLAGRMA